MFDIAAAVEQLGLFPAARFLAAARDPALIRDLDPQAPTLEGYLFPNTYRLSRHTTPDRLCRLMTGKFREAWRSLHTTAGVHHTVTLASMVEKEGKLPEERPRIAAVFENRLRIGMKLDCDPTTIYAALLQQHYRGAIHRTDLDSDHAYNTYRHPGLPPGPIANPGLASIRAVLSPVGQRFALLRGCAPMAPAGTSSPPTSPRMKARWSATAVASASKSVKQQLRDYLAANQPAAITEAVWQDLLLRLAPVSESYLRDLLRDTGLPFDQPYAGIRQHTFEELEQSLRDDAAGIRESLAAGDRDRARYCRRQVIAAKDRAKFLASPRAARRKSARKKKRWPSGCWSGWKTPKSSRRGSTHGRK